MKKLLLCCLLVTVQAAGSNEISRAFLSRDCNAPSPEISRAKLIVLVPLTTADVTGCKQTLRTSEQDKKSQHVAAVAVVISITIANTIIIRSCTIAPSSSYGDHHHHPRHHQQYKNEPFHRRDHDYSHTSAPAPKLNFRFQTRHLTPTPLPLQGPCRAVRQGSHHWALLAISRC